MDRQSRAWLLAVGMALAATLCSLPLKAEEVSSVYTAHDLAKCADITPADAKDYGTVWRCKGYEGIDVRMAEGDLRIFVSYGPKAETQTAANATLPQFNNIGDTLEWRLAKAGGRWKPFATILRFSWGVDDRKGATLVVTKLGKERCLPPRLCGSRGQSEGQRSSARHRRQRRARLRLQGKHGQALWCRRQPHQGLSRRWTRGVSA